MSRAVATGLLGTALCISGLLFALPSLLVPGLALTILSLASTVWTRTAGRHAGLEVSPGQARVEEGAPVAVTALSSLPRWSPPAELVLPSLGREGASGRRSPALSVEARFQRRGRQTLGPARLRLRDPLGISERVACEASAQVLVLPRVEPVRPGRRGGADGLEGSSRSGVGPELEFDSLRPHRMGSPASRIHWPTVARTGELIERRLRPESDARPLVVLDSASPESGEALDRAVRAAASLCRALASGGGCRLLLAGERKATAIEPDLRAWPAAHARLALVEPARAPVAIPPSLGVSALFWVTAARRRGPRALARSPAAHRYLVTVGGAAAGGAFTVAGCVGSRLERSRARAA